MNWIIFIPVFIILIYLRYLYGKKINREEAQSLKIDGKATYLRMNYTPLIDGLLSTYGYKILRERIDALSLGKENNDIMEEITILQSFPYIKIIQMTNKQIDKEWKFSHDMDAKEILSTIVKERK